MKLKDLVGKMAMRTGQNRNGDRSYVDGKPVKITDINDNYVLIGKDWRLSLDLWDDGRWVEDTFEENFEAVE